MVNYGSILIPLYIYPYPFAKWQPLIDAATQYPQVNFTAVINPDSGPAPVTGGCPNNDYVAGIAALNALPNVNTMGYVHTANRWNCGPNKNWICPATAPLDTVKANISTYASWRTLSCNGWAATKQDVHIDSLFIDEAPGQDGGANYTYMAQLAAYARSVGFNGTVNYAKNKPKAGILLFNAGAAPDLSYFSLTDQIIILEDTQAAWDALPDIDVRNGNGTYAAKSSVIIHHFSTAAAQILSTTREVLSLAQDAFPSLYITNLPNATQANIYGAFGTNWKTFVAAVNTTVYENKAYCKTHSCS